MIEFKLADNVTHVRWPWIYAHGEAEDLCDRNQGEEWMAPDIIGSMDGSVYDIKQDGEVPCTVYGEPAILFIWSDGRFGDGKRWPHGLVCLKSDTKSCEYARKAMLEKRLVI